MVPAALAVGEPGTVISDIIHVFVQVFVLRIINPVTIHMTSNCSGDRGYTLNTSWHHQWSRCSNGLERSPLDHIAWMSRWSFPSDQYGLSFMVQVFQHEALVRYIREVCHLSLSTNFSSTCSVCPRCRRKRLPTRGCYSRGRSGIVWFRRDT